MKKRISTAAIFLTAALAAGAANGQATVKPDGKWRFALGAGASVASGNSDSTTVNFSGEGVRATKDDKWTAYAGLLYGENNGVTSADRIGLGGRYDRNIDERWFGFGGAEYLRDKPANLAPRFSVNGGVGYHVIKSEQTTWDVFGGVGYVHDSFQDARLVAGEVRSTYGRAELVLGEESTHRLTETTSFKQRLVIFPNMSDTGEFRSVFDAGLAVAIDKTLSMTVTLAHRYNSDPGLGLSSSDTLFIVGVSSKID